MVGAVIAAILALLAASPVRAAEQEVAIPAELALLRAKLALPSGPVTGRAVVALHGCGGPFPRGTGSGATS